MLEEISQYGFQWSRILTHRHYSQLKILSINGVKPKVIRAGQRSGWLRLALVCTRYLFYDTECK